ncbi:hypothetical protein ABW21_db0203019 [Orbilia brochopaga]|nr:hypothetical protein ABW21_db0203019 [Drechslerella brochopaga]
MVCEYAIFQFPDCGCSALVPVQYCPHHLDPSNPAYDPNPKTLQNPARITMLFKGPAVPLNNEEYMSLVKVYQDPFLQNGHYSDEELERLDSLRQVLTDMQKKEIELSDGSTVPTAGFHTKLCRYHVIWPNCKELKVWRVSEGFFPFLETRCLRHSNCIRTDENGKLKIHVQKVPERFEESFEERVKNEWHRLQQIAQIEQQNNQNGNGNPAEEPHLNLTTTTVVVGGEDSEEEDATQSASKAADEGSEYRGSDESSSEDEPSGRDGKKRPKETLKKPIQETGAQHVTTGQNQKTKKKKNVPKRKPNKGSDTEWKEDGGSDDSEETVPDKTLKKPAPGKNKNQAREEAEKVDSTTPPHKSRSEKIKEAAKVGEKIRAASHEESRSTENPKDKIPDEKTKAKTKATAEEYRDDTSDSQSEKPRPKGKNQNKKKKYNSEDSEYEDEHDSSYMESQPKVKHNNNRGNRNKNAKVQDLGDSTDTGMRIYRPARDHHKIEFFKNMANELPGEEGLPHSDTSI